MLIAAVIVAVIACWTAVVLLPGHSLPIGNAGRSVLGFLFGIIPAITILPIPILALALIVPDSRSRSVGAVLLMASLLTAVIDVLVILAALWAELGDSSGDPYNGVLQVVAALFFSDLLLAFLAAYFFVTARVKRPTS